MGNSTFFAVLMGIGFLIGVMSGIVGNVLVEAAVSGVIG